jgi:hypothetical protein
VRGGGGGGDEKIAQFFSVFALLPGHHWQAYSNESLDQAWKVPFSFFATPPLFRAFNRNPFILALSALLVLFSSPFSTPRANSKHNKRSSHEKLPSKTRFSMP